MLRMDEALGCTHHRCGVLMHDVDSSFAMCFRNLDATPDTETDLQCLESCSESPWL